MLKATVVIFLSIILGVSSVMAIRSQSRSAIVKASIAGLAFILLMIVLKPEK